MSMADSLHRSLVFHSLSVVLSVMILHSGFQPCYSGRLGDLSIDRQDVDQQTVGTLNPPKWSLETNFLAPTELFPMCKYLGAGPAEVTLNATQISSAKWRGWGTSLSWFTNYIGGLPENQLNELLDLLFDPVKGLGLNMARYNIVGGRDPATDPPYPWPHEFYWNFGTSFKTTADSPYNWTADPFQRRCLLGAKARGANVFTAAAYSPPWWATVIRNVTGARVPVVFLNPDMAEEFADYLTEVVLQYATNPAWNITFESIDPVNEPSGIWGYEGRQEGCTFEPPDYYRAYAALDASLKAKKLNTKVGGFDDWALAEFRNLNGKMDKATLDLIQEAHVHSYIMTSTSDPYLAIEYPYTGIRDAARRLGKDVWQTEWTLLRHGGADLDLGLVLARNIIECVNYMGVVAYVFWQAIDKTERFSLVSIYWDPFQQWSYPHVITKKFWVMKHFTMLAPPGSFPVVPESQEACEHCITAFFNPEKSSLAVFVVNQQENATSVRLTLSGFRRIRGANQRETRLYRTSETESFELVEQQGGGTSTGGSVFEIPGKSLTTIVFSGITREG